MTPQSFRKDDKRKEEEIRQLTAELNEHMRQMQRLELAIETRKEKITDEDIEIAKSSIIREKLLQDNRELRKMLETEEQYLKNAKSGGLMMETKRVEGFANNGHIKSDRNFMEDPDDVCNESVYFNK